MKNNQLFCCYETNSNSLIQDAGLYNFNLITKDKNSVVECVIKQIDEGKDNGFVVDSQYGEVTASKLLKDLDEKGIFITMFREYQENWNECYDIEAKAVDKNLEKLLTLIDDEIGIFQYSNSKNKSISDIEDDLEF